MQARSSEKPDFKKCWNRKGGARNQGKRKTIPSTMDTTRRTARVRNHERLPVCTLSISILSSRWQRCTLAVPKVSPVDWMCFKLQPAHSCDFQTSILSTIVSTQTQRLL